MSQPLARRKDGRRRRTATAIILVALGCAITLAAAAAVAAASPQPQQPPPSPPASDEWTRAHFPQPHAPVSDTAPQLLKAELSTHVVHVAYTKLEGQTRAAAARERASARVSRGIDATTLTLDSDACSPSQTPVPHPSLGKLKVPGVAAIGKSA